ncbi:hypothetical protein FOL47_000769, partial [Perkinsus chesapeaki]
GDVQKCVSANGVLTIDPGGNEGLGACDKVKETAKLPTGPCSYFTAPAHSIVPWSDINPFGNPQRAEKLFTLGYQIGLFFRGRGGQHRQSDRFWRLGCLEGSGSEIVLYQVQGGSHWVHLDWRDIYKVHSEELSIESLFEGIEMMLNLVASFVRGLAHRVTE